MILQKEALGSIGLQYPKAKPIALCKIFLKPNSHQETPPERMKQEIKHIQRSRCWCQFSFLLDFLALRALANHLVSTPPRALRRRKANLQRALKRSPGAVMASSRFQGAGFEGLLCSRKQDVDHLLKHGKASPSPLCL